MIKETDTQDKVGMTGAVRSASGGRGRYDLLPGIVMDRLAKHLEKGALKYGDDNWRKGMFVRRYLCSLLRHAFQIADGDETEDHLAAIIFNAGGIMDVRDKIKNGERPEELEDLFDDGQFRRYYGRGRNHNPNLRQIKNTSSKTVAAGEPVTMADSAGECKEYRGHADSRE